MYKMYYTFAFKIQLVVLDLDIKKHLNKTLITMIC